jgi:predicted ABC-type ATPase
MLKRINDLSQPGEDFAFETTLSTRSYVKFIEKAKNQGYQITFLFFFLDSEELAISRVATKVKEGGHHISEEVIRRRYKSGLKNFFNLFLQKVDNWLFVNNSGDSYEIIAEGSLNSLTVNNVLQWEKLNKKYYGN